MAAPLTNPIWIYGSDDDTLFRLIVLGTLELQKQGYTRKGSEFVVGPMPPFGDTIKTDDDNLENYRLDQVSESYPISRWLFSEHVWAETRCISMQLLGPLGTAFTRV